jgi:hypothetical protein
MHEIAAESDGLARRADVADDNRALNNGLSMRTHSRGE